MAKGERHCKTLSPNPMSISRDDSKVEFCSADCHSWHNICLCRVNKPLCPHFSVRRSRPCHLYQTRCLKLYHSRASQQKEDEKLNQHHESLISCFHNHIKEPSTHAIHTHAIRNATPVTPSLCMLLALEASLRIRTALSKFFQSPRLYAAGAATIRYRLRVFPSAGAFYAFWSSPRSSCAGTTRIVLV